jgi:hypothetical protein
MSRTTEGEESPPESTQLFRPRALRKTIARRVLEVDLKSTKNALFHYCRRAMENGSVDQPAFGLRLPVAMK